MSDRLLGTNKIFPPVNTVSWSSNNSCSLSYDHCSFHSASLNGLQLSSSDLSKRYKRTIEVRKGEQELKGSLVVQNTTQFAIENIVVTMNKPISLTGMNGCRNLSPRASCVLSYDIKYSGLQDDKSYLVTIYGDNNADQNYFNQLRFLALPWDSNADLL